ncbi:MAG: hypothetical protein RBQ74_00005, partial [Defluviitoga tunisiensis]|nr:hypothetical protein [Defluviitoga tunisiensis]
MKKRIILLLFLTTLAIFTFAIPEIQVSESSLHDTIFIEMKLYKLVLDKDGHIVSFELYDNRTKKFNLVYEYIGDSFDVLDETTMEEILPISYDYFVPNDRGYIEIRYFYPEQGEKIYKFYNDPNFHFDVEFKNLTGYITLPTISYTSGIRYKNNDFVSYIDKSPLTGA